MYPYIIILTSKVLVEYYDDNGNLYGCVDDVNDIGNEINEFIEEIINLHFGELEYQIKENVLDWTGFCETVNAEPYDDSTFFNIKYFDYRTKQWIDYNIEQIELEHAFIKIVKKIFEKKIKLSMDVVKCIDRVNCRKIKSYVNNNIDKSELTVEL